MTIYRKFRNIAKQIFWFIQGFKIKNPDLLPESKNILFICYGNIIRSVFAEKIMRCMLMESGKNNIALISAGVKAKPGSVSPENAIKVARTYNIELASHRSKLLTMEMVEQSDLIVCMEKWHWDVILNQYSVARDKLYLLSLFCDDINGKDYFLKYNIPDPYGKEEGEFEVAFKRISDCVKALMKEISKINN